jgi:hypothetical protein
LARVRDADDRRHRQRARQPGKGPGTDSGHGHSLQEGTIEVIGIVAATAPR